MILYLTAQPNKHLWSRSFYGSATWAWLTWCLCLTVSPKTTITLLSAGLQSSQGSTGGGSASKLPQVDVTGLKDHFQGHTHGLSTGQPHGTAAGFPQSVQSRRESERQFPEWKPQSFSIMCLEWHHITSAIFYSIWSMCQIPLKDVALKPPHPSKAFDKLCLQNTFRQK